jgi:hypothetical protein
MKANEVKVGMKVAVNDLPTGQVYTVSAIHGLIVNLTYKAINGRVMQGGTGIDVSCLRKPTKAQLANNPLQA